MAKSSSKTVKPSKSISNTKSSSNNTASDSSSVSDKAANTAGTGPNTVVNAVTASKKRRAETADLPRGGGSSSILTPKEAQEARIAGWLEAANEAGTNDSTNASIVDSNTASGLKTEPNGTHHAGRKRRRQSGPGTQAPERKKDDSDVIRIYSCSSNNIHPGMIFLGRITSINDTDITVSLPNNIRGFLPFSEISTSLAEKITALAEDDNSEKEDRVGKDDKAENHDNNDNTGKVEDSVSKSKDSTYSSSSAEDTGDTDGSHSDLLVEDLLDSVFQIGERVRVAVVSVSKKHISLTAMPHKVNRYPSFHDLTANTTLNGSIISLEDHGAIIDIGDRAEGAQITGFCPIDVLNRVPGAIVEHSTHLFQLATDNEEDNLENRRVLRLDLPKSPRTVTALTNPQNVLPGDACKFLISSVRENGLAGKIFGTINCTIDVSNLSTDVTDLFKKCKISSIIDCRIIGQIVNNPPRLSATLLPFIAKQSFLQKASTNDFGNEVYGRIFDDVEIANIQPQAGALCKIPDVSYPAFVHVSKLASNRTVDLRDVSGKSEFTLGTKHRARCIGFDPYQRQIQLSFEHEVLARKFLRADQVPVGEIVTVSVVQLTKFGCKVSTKDGIEAFVPLNHLSDTKLSQPELKFTAGKSLKGRVWNFNNEKKRLILTLKKSLVEWDGPLFMSYTQDYLQNERYPGIVLKLLPSGAVVEFFGNIRGFLPTAEISEAFVNSPEQTLSVGQMMQVYIRNCDSELRKIRLSCRKREWSSEQQRKFEEIVVPSISKVSVIEKHDSELVFMTDGVYGRMPLAHTSDKDIKHCERQFSRLRVGQTINEMLLLRKNNRRQNLLGSLKKSLIDASKELKLPCTINDFHEGQIYKGYVQNVKDFGVFVAFAGDLTGLALHKNALLPNQLQDLALVYSLGQSVLCKCVKIDTVKSRILLSLTDLEPDQKRDSNGIALCDICKVTITKVKESQLQVEFGNGLRGRVEVSMIYDSYDSIPDPQKPLKQFCKGQEIDVRVLGYHNVKTHKYLPISHRQGVSTVYEMSMKPSDLEVEQSRMFEASDMHAGVIYTGFVNHVQKDCVFVNISPNARGRIALLELSDDLVKLRDPAKHFPVGSAVRCCPIQSDNMRKLLALSVRATQHNCQPLIFDSICEGDVVCGMVSKRHDTKLVVTIAEGISGLVMLEESSDDFELEPFARFSVGDLVRVCVVQKDVGTRSFKLSLRPSRTISKTISGRDPVIHSVKDLEVGQRYRGYINNITTHGMFVSLCSGISARVKISEVSDVFVADWQNQFVLGQLVEGQVIQIDEATQRIEFSLRKNRNARKRRDSNSISDATVAAAAQKPLADIQKGQVLSGTVKHFEPYGVFIHLNEYQVDGLCHRSEIADTDVIDIKSIYRKGDSVRAVVLGIDTAKRRVSLGLKSSYFPDEEMSDESDAEEQSDPVREQEKIPSDEQSEPRTKAASTLSIAEESTPVLKTKGFRWDGQLDFNSDSDADSGAGMSASAAEAVTVSKEAVTARSRDDVVDVTAELDELEPQTASDFERRLLSRPNLSVEWIRYASFAFERDGGVDSARQILRRALSTISFRAEREKLNIWGALLNLERVFGTAESLEDAFTESCRYNEEYAMYKMLADMYEKSDAHDRADAVLQRALKKCGREIAVWALYDRFLLRNGREDQVQELLRSALQRLDATQHVAVTLKFAQEEFKHGVPERGRTLFEGILSSSPGRFDVWNVFLDMEIRAGDPDIIRALFERILGTGLSSKKAKHVFKRWLAWEQENGSAKQQETVKERARAFVNELAEKRTD